MTTQNETIKKEETSQGTFPEQANPLKGQFQAPFSTFNQPGFPTHGTTIIQNFYPPVLTHHEKDCSKCEETLISYVIEILNQFSQLTPEEQSIILKMVKDSSITSPRPDISNLINKVMLGMVKDSSIT